MRCIVAQGRGLGSPAIVAVLGLQLVVWALRLPAYASEGGFRAALAWILVDVVVDVALLRGSRRAAGALLVFAAVLAELMLLAEVTAPGARTTATLACVVAEIALLLRIRRTAEPPRSRTPGPSPRSPLSTSPRPLS